MLKMFFFPQKKKKKKKKTCPEVSLLKSSKTKQPKTLNQLIDFVVTRFKPLNDLESLKKCQVTKSKLKNCTS